MGALNESPCQKKRCFFDYQQEKLTANVETRISSGLMIWGTGTQKIDF